LVPKYPVLGNKIIQPQNITDILQQNCYINTASRVGIITINVVHEVQNKYKHKRKAKRKAKKYRKAKKQVLMRDKSTYLEFTRELITFMVQTRL